MYFIAYLHANFHGQSIAAPITIYVAADKAFGHRLECYLAFLFDYISSISSRFLLSIHCRRELYLFRIFQSIPIHLRVIMFTSDNVRQTSSALAYHMFIVYQYEVVNYSGGAVTTSNEILARGIVRINKIPRRQRAKRLARNSFEIENQNI